MIYGNKSAILIVNELHFYYFVDALFHSINSPNYESDKFMLILFVTDRMCKQV